MKVQIWWNLRWAVESLKFCTLVCSFCKNHIKFQLKKRLISHNIEERCRVRKADLRWSQIWHEEFGEFSPNHSKVQKFHSNGLFLSKVYEVWAKKKERSYLSWHWTVMQNLRNPDIVVSKMAWRIGWTFIIRAPKSLKIVHWWALIVQSIYCFS